jgi:hypothetical protein
VIICKSGRAVSASCIIHERFEALHPASCRYMISCVWGVGGREANFDDPRERWVAAAAAT